MILCKRKDKAAKIESLLNELNIHVRFYNGEPVSDYFNELIDYKVVEEILNQKRNKSLQYLISAIEK